MAGVRRRPGPGRRRPPLHDPTASASPTAPELIAAIEERLADAAGRSTGSRCWPRPASPPGKVRTLDEVYTWEQTLSQGLLVDVDHPTLGTVQLPGPPLRLETLAGAPAGRKGHSAPPLLGQHDDEILRWLEEGNDR